MKNGNSIAMDNALLMLQDGRFTLDENGGIWRCACFRSKKWVAIHPRRAENAGAKGYLRLTMQIYGKLHSVQAARVIWTHLRGPIPNGLQINHKDKNRTNNNIENLEVVTNQENMDHAWSMGKNKPWCNGGSGFWRGKKLLDASAKTEIQTLRKNGLILREISKITGVSMTHISRICSVKGGQE